MEPTPDALYSDRVRRFTEFLEPSERGEIHDKYRDEVQRMLKENRTRIIVELDDLRNFDRRLWTGVLLHPADFLPALTQALKECALTNRDATSHVDIGPDTQFFVGFSGTFGSHMLSPRTIDSSYLGKLVCVEGIVTRCTIVRPKVARTIHYGAATNEFFARDYRDQTTSFDPMPTTTTYPVDDGKGNPLVVEYGLSTYRDHQTLSIQEMPERAPAGQLPRGMDIIMDDDLVDQAKPGDRVQLVGVYRSVGSAQASRGSSGGSSSTFKALLLGNNVVMLNSKGNSLQAPISSINDIDLRAIATLARRENIFGMLARSLAPSIYGFEYIKRAVLLQLLGGLEKILDNGTHIRGDINVLMVGDPSTAKSQMLRFVLNTAPLAIATTGRGSTGVGLTAAVTTDRDTGERRLEAGAMVMADRGIVCVDEFDKMNDADRVAIHEVMEQQTVTISKAGIHTTLNARCSVLAAANPAYGQYDPHKEPHRNIALPDSLLSRFDLLFVVTDDVDDSRDRLISEHVLHMHQYLPSGVTEGTPQREQRQSTLSVKQSQSAGVTSSDDEELGPTPVFVDPSESVFTIPFLKKYLTVAKNKSPELTDAAIDYIATVYSDLRNNPLAQGTRRTTPITARTLETMIRLSTAHAKARLSNQVEQRDAVAAEQLLRYAMFKEVLRPGVKRRRVADGLAALDSSDEEEVAGGEAESDEEDEEIDLESDNEEEDEFTDANPPLPPPTEGRRAHRSRSVLRTPPSDEENIGEDLGITRARLAVFEGAAGNLMADRSMFEDEAVLAQTLLEHVNAQMAAEDQFSEEEQVAALKAMHNANKLFYDENDGKIYTI